jgi:hypothetical protein
MNCPKQQIYSCLGIGGEIWCHFSLWSDKNIQKKSRLWKILWYVDYIPILLLKTMKHYIEWLKYTTLTLSSGDEDKDEWTLAPCCWEGLQSLVEPNSHPLPMCINSYTPENLSQWNETYVTQSLHKHPYSSSHPKNQKQANCPSMGKFR